MNVIIRPYNKLIDFGFIIGAWSNGAFYGALNPTKERKKEFYKTMGDKIKKHLDESEILIACMQDDPTSLMGFCVIDGTRLEWIYVKEIYRKEKIATLLLKNREITELNKENITRFGEKFLEEHPSFGQKENEDGESETGVT